MWKGKIAEEMGLPLSDNITLYPENFSESVFVCPAMGTPPPYPQAPNETYKVAYMPNTGSNFGVIGPDGGRAISAIERPLPEVMIMADGGMPDDNLAQSSTKNSYFYFPNVKNRLPISRHQGATNVLYGDFHVETVPNNRYSHWWPKFKAY